MISYKRRVLPLNRSHGTRELNAFEKTAKGQDNGSQDHNSKNNCSWQGAVLATWLLGQLSAVTVSFLALENEGIKTEKLQTLDI